MTTVNVGDVVKYQIGWEWKRATVVETRYDDFLKKWTATIEFWHMGRKERIEVWAYSLRPASVRPSVVIPVEGK